MEPEPGGGPAAAAPARKAFLVQDPGLIVQFVPGAVVLKGQGRNQEIVELGNNPNTYGTFTSHLLLTALS